MRSRLIELLEPTVEMLGYELIDLEWLSGASPAILRLYIDWPQGHPKTADGGTVDVDDCVEVSRQVSGVLDVEDPISAEYNLEVSSPGIERPLRKPEHFAEFVGERAYVQLATPNIEGRRRFTGPIVEMAGDEVVINVDGTDFELNVVDIEKAHLKPDFNEWQKLVNKNSKK